MTESEIKQLAAECRNLSMNCYANSSRERYSRIASALEQLAAVNRERDELKAGLSDANAAIDSVIDLMGNAKCVYCDWVGKRFGIAEDPDWSKNRDMLAEHVKVCPKHPMRELESQLARMREACQAFVNEFDEWDDEPETEDSSAAVARNRSRKVYRKAKDALSLSPAQPTSETPPCPPGHCDDCTGECPDGPTAASEQAPTSPKQCIHGTPAGCGVCAEFPEGCKMGPSPSSKVEDIERLMGQARRPSEQAPAQDGK
jgi:Pyruvate/2-oxoacid:ferredoxin oxidoreductase delta subunit